MRMTSPARLVVCSQRRWGSLQPTRASEKRRSTRHPPPTPNTLATNALDRSTLPLLVTKISSSNWGSIPTKLGSRMEDLLMRSFSARLQILNTLHLSGRWLLTPELLSEIEAEGSKNRQLGWISEGGRKARVDFLQKLVESLKRAAEDPMLLCHNHLRHARRAPDSIP
ncbi:hypothetical protein BDV11DRAFT_150846 [Aspergillus similis]